jgi:hypothetical protein
MLTRSWGRRFLFGLDRGSFIGWTFLFYIGTALSHIKGYIISHVPKSSKMADSVEIIR